MLITLCGFISQGCIAQQKFGGQIYENHTHIPLGGIVVENLNSHDRTTSDVNGMFIIDAKINDLLLFTSIAYANDTVYITNLNYLKVFLTLKNKDLDEVKVTGEELKTGKLSAPVETGPLGSHSVLYQTDGAGNYIGGVKFMLNDSKGYQNKKLKKEQIGIDEATKDQIVKVFSPDNIQHYLPIRGQELTNFIILYIPDIKTYTSSSFNLILYLSNSYKEFCNIPIDKRQSADFLKISSK
ncbi:hypothetical protein [Mucilaginibacter sp.]